MRPLSDLADREIDRALAAALQNARRTPSRRASRSSRSASWAGASSIIRPTSISSSSTIRSPCRESRARSPIRRRFAIGQRVVELLQKRTEEGYAFRVDLRLRPSPEVTPIVLPVDAAISYYESSALPWERAAFIRARLAAGDEPLGRYFLEAIHPFVWRRSLDFGAIAEIRSITRRIRDHYAQGQAFGPGFDVKRGRGGIREVEFFVQVHQLIHGGREPELRAAATLDALAALAGAGRIEAGEAGVLADAYRLLRTIEHRLQMVDDRQTHELPGRSGRARQCRAAARA